MMCVSKPCHAAQQCVALFMSVARQPTGGSVVRSWPTKWLSLWQQGGLDVLTAHTSNHCQSVTL